MSTLLAAFCALFLSVPAYAADVFPHEFLLEVQNTQINVGTFAPRPDDTALVIYLHGYADTMNNHEELLTLFHDGGMRVLSFDYPSHGRSEGQIWFWSIEQVASLVKGILDHEQFRSGPLEINRKLPVILVGWSTGATIAIRTAQSWRDQVIPADMRLAGIIGFAPGLPARAFVGDGLSRMGVKVKAEDLTRNPRALKHAPKPETTIFGSGYFAGSLKAASEVAYWKGSTSVPTLLLLADDKYDFFAKASSSAAWVRSAGRSVPTYGFRFYNSYHGVEFEPDGIGELSQLWALEFAQVLTQPGQSPSRTRFRIETLFRNRNHKLCAPVHTR